LPLVRQKETQTSHNGIDGRPIGSDIQSSSLHLACQLSKA